METPPSARRWYMALVIVNLLVLLAVYFFNAAGSDFIPGLFQHSVGNQSRKYYLEITPAGWTFSIWGFIFAWQAVWVLYSLVLLCIRGANGSPAYLNPALLRPPMFVLYICANVCCISWLFLFDRDLIEAAFVSLLGISVFLIAAMGVNYRTLDAASPVLVEQKRSVHIWLIRGFLHNGLGIYATWTSIATLLNLAMVLRYRSNADISDQTAGTVALVVLGLELLLFVTTDIALLDRYTRYTITPYIVVVVGVIGSISKNWEAGAVNSTISAVLLAMASAGLVLKMVMVIYRHKTRPPYVMKVSSTLEETKDGLSV